MNSETAFQLAKALEALQTGKSTRLVWSDYRFRTGLDERDFDRNSLKRTR